VSTHRTPDFKTRAISPASFENSKAPPLPGSERIMCRGRSPRRLVHSEVVLITGLIGVRVALTASFFLSREVDLHPERHPVSMLTTIQFGGLFAPQPARLISDSPS
jgi:hypothetical protein